MNLLNGTLLKSSVKGHQRSTRIAFAGTFHSEVTSGTHDAIGKSFSQQLSNALSGGGCLYVRAVTLTGMVTVEVDEEFGQGHQSSLRV